MWPVTFLQTRFGLTHPIIQGPMAGGPSTPELAAAVSNAGGLGSLGVAYRTPEQIRDDIRRVRALTTHAFAVNLFIERQVDADEERVTAAMALLAPYHNALGLSAPERPGPVIPVTDAQFKVLLEERVPIFSWTFGLPSQDMVQACRHHKIGMIGTATCVREGLALAEMGVDAIIAQGAEAGGHQGSFLKEGDRAPIGTFALVPQIADAVDLPVIAAGGIGDARGIAAALLLGAAGVQMGTAYLTCPEAGTNAAHRQAVLAATDESTEMTRAFSGRPARGVRNLVMDELATLPTPAFPIMNMMTQPMRRAAAAQGRGEFLSLWAGQAAALAREEPAADLTRRLAVETLGLLGRFGGGPDIPWEGHGM